MTLLQTAEKAASDLHSGQAPLQETLYSLRVLRDHIDDLINAIREDIRREAS